MSHWGNARRQLTILAAVVSVAGLVQVTQATAGRATSVTASRSVTTGHHTSASRASAGATSNAKPSSTPAATAKAVVCNGSIALGTSKSCTLPAGGGTASYTFTVSGADTVRFRTTVAAGSYDRTMTVYDAGSTVVCDADGIGVRECRVPEAGTYRLDVTLANAVTVRTTVDTVSHAACGGAVDLTVGAPGVPVAITVPGRSWCAAIDAAPGDVLQFGLDVPGDGALDVDAYSVTGQRVCNVPFISSYGRTYCTVAGGAAVRLFATPEDDVAQTVSLTVTRVSMPDGCVTRDLDTFRAAPNHRGTLTSHSERCYSLTAPSKYVGIHLLGVGEVPQFDLTWSIRSADGVEACSGYPDDRFLVDPILDTCKVTPGASYTLFIASQTSTDIRYTTDVVDLAARAGCSPVADPSWGGPATTTSLPVAAQVNCYSVTPAAGDHPVLRVNLDDARQDVTFASVVNRAGHVVCTVRDTSDCTLPAAGPYRVLVYASTTRATDVTYWIVDTSSAVGCDPTTPDAMGTAPTRSAAIGNGIRAHCWTVAAPAGASYFLHGGATDNSNLFLTGELRSLTGDFQCRLQSGSCTVPAAGTYVLVLEFGSSTMTAADAGTGTVGIWRLDRPTSCPVAGTSFGAPAIESDLSARYEVDCHQFAAAAGDLEFVHTVPFDYNPLHQIFDSTGALACFAFDGTCTLTGTGPYHVITYSAAFSTDPTPSYRLRIASLTKQAGCSTLNPTAFGQAPSRSIDESDPIDMRCYHVASPSAGARLGLEIADLTPDNFGVRVDVYSPSLQQICSLSSSLGTCVTPTAGTYLVLVHAGVGFTGRIGVYDLTSSAGCVTGPTLAFGTPATAAAISAPGMVDCLTVPYVANDRGRLNFGPTDTDVGIVASVLDDSGRSICSFENDFPEPRTCRMPATITGRVRILVSAFAFGTSDTGSFSLHAWRLNAPTGCTDIGSLRDGFGPLVGTLADPEDEACYTARARVGTLAVTTSNLNVPTRVPSVDFVRASGAVGCTVTGSGTCNLDQNGQYSILVRRHFADRTFTGHYRVSGDCTSAVCGP